MIEFSTYNSTDGEGVKGGEVLYILCCALFKNNDIINAQFFAFSLCYMFLSSTTLY